MEETTENGGGQRGSRDVLRRLRLHRLNSAAFLTLAILIQASVIAIEDEPTALAPLLVLVGIAWHAAAQIRLRRHLRDSAGPDAGGPMPPSTDRPDRIMTGMTDGSDRRRTLWRVARWTVVALILTTPAVAMQFTDDVQWSAGDFFFAGVLLIGAMGTYELVTRKAGGLSYRIAVGATVLTSLLLVWVIAAVGLIGAEGDPFDLAYGGVLSVLLLGATLARLEPRGMARVLFATALAHGLVVVIALFVGKQHAAASSVGEILGANAFFIVLWIWSALLFRNAVDEAAPATGPAATPPSRS